VLLLQQWLPWAFEMRVGAFMVMGVGLDFILVVVVVGLLFSSFIFCSGSCSQKDHPRGEKYDIHRSPPDFQACVQTSRTSPPAVGQRPKAREHVLFVCTLK